MAYYDTNRDIYFLSSCCAVNSAKGGGEREVPWHMKTKTLNKSMITDE